MWNLIKQKTILFFNWKREKEIQELKNKLEDSRNLLICISSNLKKGMSRSIQKLQAATIDEELLK